jgi:ABC-type transporter lipoprotein component MlaA
LFNVAGNVFDLEKHDEDFGQTLAHWGGGPTRQSSMPTFERSLRSSRRE